MLVNHNEALNKHFPLHYGRLTLWLISHFNHVGKMLAAFFFAFDNTHHVATGMKMNQHYQLWQDPPFFG
jgi:hypothetical protein